MLRSNRALPKSKIHDGGLKESTGCQICLGGGEGERKLAIQLEYPKTTTTCTPFLGGHTCAHPECQGKVLHTRSHNNETPLENATENPLKNSSEGSRGDWKRDGDELRTEVPAGAEPAAQAVPLRHREDGHGAPGNCSTQVHKHISED